MGSKVAIIKGENPSEMLKGAFQHFNNFQGKIEGKKVVIKPNLGAWSTILPRHVNEWVVTSKELIFATISLLKELGASSITLAESAFIDIDVEDIYKDIGLTKELKDKNVELVDLSEGPFQKIQLFENVSVEISELILNAECLINMPMLKTHGLTVVSLGMKNLKGTLSDQSKRIFHRNGLEKTISHLASVIKPTINIVDGLVGLEGIGPVQTGTPIEVGVIIVGDNLVATDAVAASIMGFNPEEIPNIKLANELGIGPSNLSSIELVGASIESARVPFKPAPSSIEGTRTVISWWGLPEDQIFLNYTDHWCSMCFMNLMGTIWALRDDAGPQMKEKLYILADKTEVPAEYKGKLVLFGNCQARNKAKVHNDDYIFIKGCPPGQMSVYTTLGKTLYSRKRFIWGMLKRIFKGKKLSWLPQWKEALEKE
ncbi:MAG: DUF362 domain-containing protein [Candidatus Helarchaeota archaeon]|nr:DUF362 domain-containing protein [Candidatus Helarchaeota archaeon]